MTAVMPTGTPSQTTAYVYGVTTAGGSAINSNDLLAKVEYPDASHRRGQHLRRRRRELHYDALGETVGMTDQNGTTHASGYDVLGRQTSDADHDPRLRRGRHGAPAHDELRHAGQCATR